MIKDYESMIILKPQLNLDEAAKENEKIIAFLTENGGEFVKTDSWGKRQLAYPIQKNHEGYYFINYFKFDSENVKNINVITIFTNNSCATSSWIDTRRGNHGRCQSTKTKQSYVVWLDCQ